MHVFRFVASNLLFDNCGWAIHPGRYRDPRTDDLLTVHIRHKAPKGTKADEAAFAWQAADMSASFAAAPADLRFAFAVAAFADVLRGAEDAEHWTLADIRAIAAGAAEGNADRLELVELIDQAIALKGGAKSFSTRRAP